MQSDKVRISQGQVTKFERCQLRWWNEYGPHGVRPPGGPSRWLGSAVHLGLEEYMKTGEVPDTIDLAIMLKADKTFEEWTDTKRLALAKKAVRIATPVDKLPTVGSMELERAVEIPCGEATLIGFVDMCSVEQSYIGDHKTTSNLSWAKTQTEVEHDPQLLTYAWAVFHEDPPPEVTVELLYRTTKGMVHTMNVRAVVPWSRVAENWADMVARSADLVAHKYDNTPDKLTPNLGACHDFGGCDHVDRCPHSPKNRHKQANIFEAMTVSTDGQQPTTTTTKGNDTMNTPEDIRKRLGLSRFLPPDAPPQVEQTEALKAATAAKVAEHPEHKAEIENGMGATPAAFFEAPEKPAAKKSLTKADLSALSERLAHGDDAEVAYWDTADIVKETFGRNLTQKRWATVVASAGLTEFEGVLTDPKQLEPEAVVEPDPPQSPPVAVQPPTVTAMASVNEAEAPTLDCVDLPVDPPVQDGLTVLVDCYFEKTPQGVTTLTEFLAPFQEAVNASSGVNYYELIEYNQGAKQVAGQMLAEFFKAPPTGVLLVDSSDPLAGRVLAVLRSVPSAVIIRGR